MQHSAQLFFDQLLSKPASSPTSLSVGRTGVVLYPAPPLTIGLDEASRLFSGDVPHDFIELRVRWGDLSGVRREASVFDSGGSWALRRGEGNPGDWIFDVYTPVFGPTPFRSARLQADLAGGEIILEPGFYRGCDGGADALAFPFAELVVTHLLARSGGVEFHGCGLRLEDGRGVLFVGHSGAGKTTSARLWDGMPGVTILSDDRIIVRDDLTPRPPLQMERGWRKAGGEVGNFRIYGTPWHGEGQFAANLDAPLAAIFILEHASKTEVVPITGADAVTALFSRAFPPFYDAGAVESVLAAIDLLAKSVPCFRFPFVPDETAVETVRRTVNKLAP